MSDEKEWLNPDVAPGIMRKVEMLHERRAEAGINGDSPKPTVQGAPRALKSNSYLTVVDLLRSNVRDILDNRELYYDRFSEVLMLGKHPVVDNDLHIIRANIEARIDGGCDKDGTATGIKASSTDVFAALEQVGRENPRNPLLDRLLATRWDGTPRIDDLGETCLGAEPTRENKIMLRSWFISAVARAFLPGCKVDTMLVLIGKQGVRKSSFGRVLGEPWYMDTTIDVHSKDAPIALRGKWLCEWPEMEALRRRDATTVKSFQTVATDTYRPPYGRFSVSVPRSSIFFGTTNDYQFLSDATGNRRYLPVPVKRVDTELLAKFRDQIWAEAVHYQLALGEKWYFEQDDLIALLEATQEAHREQDPWEEQIRGWLQALLMDDEITSCRILDKAIEKPVEKRTRADEMRVGTILRRLGYERHHTNTHWAWRKRAAK